MELFGRKLTKAALRKRVGDMDQVAGIRIAELQDGRARPMRVALVRTGSGLELTLLVDRCLDVAAASYNGRPLGWRSTTGDVAPAYFEPEGFAWLRSFNGGLVATCGLRHVGAPPPNPDIFGAGLHGRIGNLPAENLKVTQEWQGNDYVLSISGTMRETAVFGQNLTLTRTVSTKLGAKSFHIHDVVTNESFDAAGFQLLYHCNIGWPAVDAGSRLLSPTRQVAPRDEIARKGQDQWNRFDAPTHGYAEQVFFHDMAPAAGSKVCCAIVNDAIGTDSGFGVFVKYDKRQLPRFAEWKMMGEQNYVVGLEPANCGVLGRHVDEQHGLLHRLAPGEARAFDLEIGPVTDAAEVKDIERQCGKQQTKIVENYLAFAAKVR